MKIGRAVLAACAGALALAATPSHAGDPIPGVDVNLGKQGGASNRQAGQGTTKPAANEKSFLGGDASVGVRRQGKISDNESPRPVNR